MSPPAQPRTRGLSRRQRNSLRTITLVALAIVLSVSAGARLSHQSSARAEAGVAHFVKDAGSPFDPEDTVANATWMRTHFARMITYSPYFDSRTLWYRNAWVYRDAYAIGRNAPLAREHADWILRDVHGNPLYIPYRLPPTQYAGDITNPEFRRYWIAHLKRTLAHGYKGVFVDDVDMWANTCDLLDNKVIPVSGVTHQPISDEAWREYMVQFMQELRAAIPGYEVVQNSVWYADGGSPNRGTTAAIVRHQIETADIVDVERGVDDRGLTGSGRWSIENLLTYIDEVHALGKGVIMAGTAVGDRAMEYNLAAYFLISTGKDFVAGGGNTQTVKNFWPGWSVRLGGAKGPRYRWNGLLRRDFERGTVYLDPPAGPEVLVAGRRLTASSGAVVPRL